ncbi:MAG: dihydrolipoyl dehydrogenase [Hyphomicrobiales bacterium]|nr:dihydrolipoyl dehydrogenase [Rickettsiales bacterium]MCP5361617.1 dihydrolipoyl dehydrogenase [Hyphomicrobiales bacterium]
MSNTQAFDVVIIGGGPGGYVAAIRAAQLGMKTALVEREHLGGICLNWGCIPTKALLRSAEVYHLLTHAEEYGFKTKGVEIQFDKIVARSRGVAKQLSDGIRHLMKKNKVEVFEGHGKLNGPGAVMVKNGDTRIAELKAQHIILATGARARSLPGLEADGKHIWSYKEAMTPKSLPKTLLVIGSGAIGIEFASFYRTLGVEVAVVEVLERILPAEDAEISALAQKRFEATGMTIHTATKVSGLKSTKTGISATLEDTKGKTQELKAERAILAVGITGNTEHLGLEGTKVRVEKGHVEVNEWLETGEPGVYAIGDLAGAPWLAHKASHEGVICVEKIAGQQGVHPMKRSLIPGCTYSHPQVASVGMTEAQAKEKGIEVRVGRFPFIGNGKAIALGEPEGLVKTIYDAKSGELLGAHMIGAEVTELIQGFVIGKTMEATEADFMHTIFPHPTLSEMMHEATLAAYGKALHF